MSENEEISCSVSQSFYFMFWMAKLHGVAPITYAKKTDGYKISISQISIVINYVVVTIFNVILILTLIKDMNLHPDKSTHYRAGIRSLVWITDMLGTVGIVGIAVYGGPMRTKEDIRNISRIKKINTELSKLKVKNHREGITDRVKIMKWGSLYFTFLISCLADGLVFLYSCFQKGRDVMTACCYTPFMIYYFITYFLIFQFSFTTFEICDSMVTFNDILEEIGSEKVGFNPFTVKFNSSPEKTTTKVFQIKVKPADFTKSTASPLKQPHEIIRHLALAYDYTCDVVRRNDDNYAFGRLILSVISFLRLVITPYNLILNIAGQNVNLPLLVIQFLWLFLQMVAVVILIEPCYKSLLEVDRTNLLVGKLTIRCTDQLVCQELEKFSRYLALNKVDYTPLGIYRLSRCLIASIAGSVCTYLVIIFQFQVPDSGEY